MEKYVIVEYRDDNGRLHADEGPAKTVARNGKLLWEFHYQHGLLHREGGPAKIMYYPNGSFWSIEFWIEGEFHRDGGPAWVVYDADGNVVAEQSCGCTRDE